MPVSTHHPRTGHDGAPATAPRRTTTVTAISTTAALALAAGPLLFLTAEATAATAWKGPSYNYATRWISDLGVPTPGTLQGRDIDSPLHAVLNTALSTHGLLLLVGVVLLAALLPPGTQQPGRARTRAWLVSIAAACAAGFAATGLFHTSTAAAQDGTLALHYAGATIGVTGVGVLALLTGSAWRSTPATRSLGRVSTALGAIALVALLTLVLTTIASPTAEVPHGLVERCAVYAGIAWQFLAAAHLLRRPVHRT